MSVTNELEVGLPPLSSNRRTVWDYYRIEFLADGYPGRRTGDMVHPHPIYGPYVINDYLAQHKSSGDPLFLEAATRVAAAAVSRMEPVSDALIFRYYPGTGVSSLPDEFYSGLTQGRYLSSLGRLDAAVGDGRFRDAGEAILRSLTLPADDGGVARRTPGGGLIIEEYSHEIPDYTLNGWTTATVLVHEYAEATDSEAARQVFHESIRGIADVLPLYDVPELGNSRYRLSGQVKVRLAFQHPGTRVRSAALRVPGQGSYDVRHGGARKWSNQWLSGVAEDGTLTKTTATLDTVLCRLSWPRPNSLRLELDSPEGGRFVVKVAEGKYDPLTAVAPTTGWNVVHKQDLQPGEHLLDVPIPWGAAELVAYPTNFGKPIGGKNYNWYHFIHVDTLRKLAKITGHPMLEYYRDRWAAYPDRWPSIPEYMGADIELVRHQH